MVFVDCYSTTLGLGHHKQASCQKKKKTSYWL